MKYLAALILLIASPVLAQQAVPEMGGKDGASCPANTGCLTVNAQSNVAQPITITMDDAVVAYTDWSPTEYPTMGNVPCEYGFRLQRYHDALAVYATTGQDAMYAGWRNVDAGPHDGDYRCVKNEEPALHRRDEGERVNDFEKFTHTAEGARPTEYEGTVSVYVSGNQYVLPKGTKCTEEAEDVVCTPPTGTAK